MTKTSEKLNLKAAQATCKALGYKLTFDRENSEYAASPIDAGLSARKRESMTVYSNDLEDAVGTVTAEAKRNAARAAKPAPTSIKMTSLADQSLGFGLLAMQSRKVDPSIEFAEELAELRARVRLSRLIATNELKRAEGIEAQIANILTGKVTP